MVNVALQHIVIEGVILSLSLGMLIMGSLIYNPRLWLQDYPKVVQAKVPPITPHEKLQQRLLLLPVLLLMFGLPYLSVTLVKAVNSGSVTFPITYLTASGVLHVFNLFDAVVLDYLILTRIKPKFAVIPGTTIEESLHVDLVFQLRNFLKGIVFSAVAGLPIAFIASL